MVETVETYDGWYSLHDFRSVDWEKWQHASKAIREKALHEFHALIDKWQKTENNKTGSHQVFSIVGQKADLLFMFLRPEMKDLNELENTFNKTLLAHFLKPAYSFVSIIEKSSYTKPEIDPYKNPEMLKKLYPTIPDTEYVCFYPMSKLRGETNNWFTLEKKERGKMMFDHIKTAKPFTEEVKRIITGAIGLDDYEWGVTLFCDNPLLFKKLIYDTRFDEVSAKYGVFGSFYIGHLLPVNKINDYFAV